MNPCFFLTGVYEFWRFSEVRFWSTQVCSNRSRHRTHEKVEHNYKDNVKTTHARTIFHKYNRSKITSACVKSIFFPTMINHCQWHQTWSVLTGGNWQKWKRVFLTCPCHEIYRAEAVGLKSCKNTWKITIFVKMWNLGQYRENLIFCQ